MKGLYILCFSVLLAGCGMKVERADFGTTRFGEKAHLWTLRGAGGLVLRVTDYGCAVVGAEVPDATGATVDVVPGFDSAAEMDAAPGFFGVVIGRYANRIANGRFTLDGRDYELELNDPSHHANVHGGSRGWHTFVWEAEPFTRGGETGLVFTKVFPDGDGGFPGTVRATVTYTVTAENVWRIDFEAETDRATPLNPTIHTYWNMNGAGTIATHRLMIDADGYLVPDADLKPIGGPRDPAGTDFDFRSARAIGPDVAYDHNWCLNGSGFRRVAALTGEARAVEVWTDQPGLQVFATHTLPSEWRMSRARPILKNGFLALETQHWPDSPNRPDFPSTILHPGETFRSRTEYRFRTAIGE